MAITFSKQSYQELFEPSVENSSVYSNLSEEDTIWCYPPTLGRGFLRDIQLRQGLELAIANYQLYDDVVIQSPSRPHSVEFSFYLSGSERCNEVATQAGQYSICGSGLAPKEWLELSAQQPLQILTIHLDPSVLCSCLGESDKPLPANVQPWLGRMDEEYYVDYGSIHSQMRDTLQHILHCPYQGLTRRLFLESKVLELIAFLLEQTAVDSLRSTQKSVTLNTDDIDCIYQAKEILLRQLDQPPSLIELARQVGLNDCSLKRGFRQVFGTTVFGYLHHYRMERARELLASGQMTVQDVAQTVGYISRSNFAIAFRKKFGMNPSAYMRRAKNSLWGS